MLVYGDQQEEVAPAALLRDLQGEAGAFLDHDALRTRFITLAGLTQAVADADFSTHGCDRARPAEQALLEALVEHGSALMASWDAGGSGGEAPQVSCPASLPTKAMVRLPEGYAFYALYPEAFGEAARMLELSAPPRVIGLRSIGTGLAAIVAAVLGAPPPVTLRPSGDPFARSLRLDAALAAELLDGEAHFVVVDEGPGLSGSSFGCVADWLEDHGVPEDRIAFLPGHDGELGPEACERHRGRWDRVQRPVGKVERLRGWVEEVVGSVTRWDDLSGGQWRPLWSAAESDWPAVTPMWERAKYRVRASGGEWLVRFAGLGRTGEEKLALARLLERAGFGPEVAGLTNGWLIQRWHSEAVPTRPRLEELAAYLRLRAFLPARQGASLEELVTMARRNAPGFERWSPETEALQARVRPVRIDGRMAAHEWLRLPSGQLLKADALDHHQGHDLVGCQDLAWDVAGAALELDLHADEVATLEQALGVDPDLTRFYRIAYASFRYGAHKMSEGMVSGEEALRHSVAANRFERALVDAVEHAGDVDQPLGLGVEAHA
jgi:hypothetical protein